MLARDEVGGQRLGVIEDDEDAGLAEAVHSAVVTQEHVARGPLRGRPQLAASQSVVSGQHPRHKHCLMAVGIGGRVAVLHRQGGALGEVHALPVQRACGRDGLGSGSPRTAEPTSLPYPGLTVAAAEAAIEAVRADVWNRGRGRAVVQDVLDRAPLTALFQAFPVQLILLLQQRVQHAFHLPGDDRTFCTPTPTQVSELSEEIKSPVLEVPAWGARTAPIVLCLAADISDLNRAASGAGGLPGRPAGEQTHPLAGSWHPRPGLCKETLSQVSTLPTGLHSQHQKTHLDTAGKTR